MPVENSPIQAHYPGLFSDFTKNTAHASAVYAAQIAIQEMMFTYYLAQARIIQASQLAHFRQHRLPSTPTTLPKNRLTTPNKHSAQQQLLNKLMNNEQYIAKIYQQLADSNNKLVLLQQQHQDVRQKYNAVLANPELQATLRITNHPREQINALGQFRQEQINAAGVDEAMNLRPSEVAQRMRANKEYQELQRENLLAIQQRNDLIASLDLAYQNYDNNLQQAQTLGLAVNPTMTQHVRELRQEISLFKLASEQITLTEKQITTLEPTFLASALALDAFAQQYAAHATGLHNKTAGLVSDLHLSPSNQMTNGQIVDTLDSLRNTPSPTQMIQSLGQLMNTNQNLMPSQVKSLITQLNSPEIAAKLEEALTAKNTLEQMGAQVKSAKAGHEALEKQHTNLTMQLDSSQKQGIESLGKITSLLASMQPKPGANNSEEEDNENARSTSGMVPL